MTKPLSEPSQGRENAYLGWSSNQLFRRPGPTIPAPDAAPPFFFWAFNHVLLLPTAGPPTGTAVPNPPPHTGGHIWDKIPFATNTSVYKNPGADTYFQGHADSGATTGVLTLLVEGFYQVFARVTWLDYEVAGGDGTSLAFSKQTMVGQNIDATTVAGTYDNNFTSSEFSGPDNDRWAPEVTQTVQFLIATPAPYDIAIGYQHDKGTDADVRVDFGAVYLASL